MVQGVQCVILVHTVAAPGHEADARLLQGRVAAWVERFEAVKPEVEATPPMQPLPGATKAKGVAWKFDLLRK